MLFRSRPPATLLRRQRLPPSSLRVASVAAAAAAAAPFRAHVVVASLRPLPSLPTHPPQCSLAGLHPCSSTRNNAALALTSALALLFHPARGLSHSRKPPNSRSTRSDVASASPSSRQSSSSFFEELFANLPARPQPYSANVSGVVSVVKPSGAKVDVRKGQRAKQAAAAAHGSRGVKAHVEPSPRKQQPKHKKEQHRVERPLPSPPVPNVKDYLGKGKDQGPKFLEFYCGRIGVPVPEVEKREAYIAAATEPNRGKSRRHAAKRVQVWMASTSLAAHVGPATENVPEIKVTASGPNKRLALARAVDDLAARLLAHVHSPQLVDEFRDFQLPFSTRLEQLRLAPPTACFSPELVAKVDALASEIDDAAAFQVPPDRVMASAEETGGARSSLHRARPRTFARQLAVPARRLQPPAFLNRSRDLPMYSYYGELLAAIDANPVVVISAETGAGKTTQLPQFILAHEQARKTARPEADGHTRRAVTRLRGGVRVESDSVDAESLSPKKPVKVLITQPRRIAAISVAQRVAQERGEQIGRNSAVGYSVRFDDMRPRSDPDDGHIVFCTSGILLRIFQENPDLDDVTHLILDEVHERDLNTDLLLILVRQLLLRRHDLKVILMSATADTHLFARYFNVPKLLPPPPIVSVPGRLFPVRAHHLDEVAAIVRPMLGSRMLRDSSDYIRRQLAVTDGGGGPGRRAAIMDDGRDADVPLDVVEALIAHIVNEKGPGAILVFLPSWHDITGVQTRLKAEDNFRVGFADPRRFRIFTMHSSVPNAEQREVFEASPPGVRKIILATNIAETSVTIKDVVFVIDSAKIRLASYNPNSRVSSLNSVFASRSNLKQRMGRAGRVQPGEYYLLITKTKHDSLPYNLPPELLRTDLQSTVLKIASLKSLDTLVHIESMRSQSAPPGARGLDEWRPSLRREGPPIPSVCDDVSTFLAQAPTPPSTGSIGEAIDSLRALGAIGTAEVIVADNPSASAEVGSSRRRLGYQPMRRRVREAVTPLGRVLADFSVDPWVGRMVLTGVAMRCLDPVLTVASLLGGSEGGGGGGPAGVFTMRPDERSVARRVLAAAFARDGAASDVLVSARAFDAWKRVASADGMSAARAFAAEHFLSTASLLNVDRARLQLFRQLQTAGLVWRDRDEDDASADDSVLTALPGDAGRATGSDGWRLGGAALNEHAGNVGLVRAILCGATLPNLAELARKDEYEMAGQPARLRLTTSSVNSFAMTQAAALAAELERRGIDPVEAVRRIAAGTAAAANEGASPASPSDNGWSWTPKSNLAAAAPGNTEDVRARTAAVAKEGDEVVDEDDDEDAGALARALDVRVPVAMPPRLLCFQERQRVDNQTYLRQTTAAEPAGLLLFGAAAAGAGGIRGGAAAGRPLAFSTPVETDVDDGDAGGVDHKDEAPGCGGLVTAVGQGVQLRVEGEAEASAVNAVRGWTASYIQWLVWNRGMAAAARRSAARRPQQPEGRVDARMEDDGGAGAASATATDNAARRQLRLGRRLAGLVAAMVVQP